MRYTHIIFDLDGTLTDSGEGIMNSGRYAFEKLEIPVPEEQELRKITGPPLTVSFPILGVPADRIDEAIRFFRENYNQHGGKFQNSVYPGIEDLLQELKSLGCHLYVATSKLETIATEILEGFRLDSYFECIAGSTSDHSRENKGDVLKYLLEQVGHPKDIVLIGDTCYDAIGAKERGLPCIGVTWGYGSKEDLIKTGAGITIDSPEELLAYLKGVEVSES